jgi:hypothetical protein
LGRSFPTKCHNRPDLSKQFNLLKPLLIRKKIF